MLGFHWQQLMTMSQVILKVRESAPLPVWIKEGRWKGGRSPHLRCSNGIILATLQNRGDKIFIHLQIRPSACNFARTVDPFVMLYTRSLAHAPSWESKPDMTLPLKILTLIESYRDVSLDECRDVCSSCRDPFWLNTRIWNSRYDLSSVRYAQQTW